MIWMIFFFSNGKRFKSCSWKGVLTASKSQPCSGWHGWVERCSAEKYIQTGTVHKWNLLVLTAGCAVPLLRVYFGFLAFLLSIPLFLPLSVIIKRAHVHLERRTKKLRRKNKWAGFLRKSFLHSVKSEWPFKNAVSALRTFKGRYEEWSACKRLGVAAQCTGKSPLEFEFSSQI